MPCKLELRAGSLFHLGDATNKLNTKKVNYCVEDEDSSLTCERYWIIGQFTINDRFHNKMVHSHWSSSSWFNFSHISFFGHLIHLLWMESEYESTRIVWKSVSLTVIYFINAWIRAVLLILLSVRADITTCTGQKKIINWYGYLRTDICLLV